MDRLLGVAKELQKKVDSNELAATELLKQCEVLQQELKSMRQYRAVVQEMGGGEPRPKLPNIEFSYIKQLQQDNSELRSLLEEHQAALEMIMTKYRQQVSTFMNTTHEEHQLNNNDHLAEELQSRTDQVYNMAAMMYRAALIEDASVQVTTEKISRLEYENRHLRELLQFSMPIVYPNDRTQPSMESTNSSVSVQPAEVSRSTTVLNTTSLPASSDSRILHSNSVDLDSRSSTPQAMEGDQGTLDRLTFTEDR